MKISENSHNVVLKFNYWYDIEEPFNSKKSFSIFSLHEHIARNFLIIVAILQCRQRLLFGEPHLD
jgi:hypothetical protein